MNNTSICLLQNKEISDFFHMYEPSIRIASGKYCLNQHEYDELCSKLAEKFFVTGKARFNPEKNNAGYVWTIARNCADDIVRNRENNISLDNPDVPEMMDCRQDIIHSLETAELGEMLDEGFAALERNCADKRKIEIFKKAFLEKQKREKIAEEYGVTPYEVSAIQHRYRVKLMKIMTEILAKNDYEIPGRRMTGGICHFGIEDLQAA